MPCKMLAPTIEELAREYAGRLKVGKVDTDNCRTTTMKFRHQCHTDGDPVQGRAGAEEVRGCLQQKKDFKVAIDEILAG